MCQVCRYPIVEGDTFRTWPVQAEHSLFAVVVVVVIIIIIIVVVVIVVIVIVVVVVKINVVIEGT